MTLATGLMHAGTMRIREWPSTERPREKLLQRGPAFTEKSLFARINDAGELQLINHLGIDLGETPEAMAKAMASGRAMMPTMMPARRLFGKCFLWSRPLRAASAMAIMRLGMRQTAGREVN